MTDVEAERARAEVSNENKKTKQKEVCVMSHAGQVALMDLTENI